jgi:hypothetical protein
MTLAVRQGTVEAIRCTPWCPLRGTAYAQRDDTSYAAEFASLRSALELDRFGLVAHVLANQGCTPDRCDALMLFRDPSKVLANLRDHMFGEQVKKYIAVWNAPKPMEGLTQGG